MKILPWIVSRIRGRDKDWDKTPDYNLTPQSMGGNIVSLDAYHGGIGVGEITDTSLQRIINVPYEYGISTSEAVDNIHKYNKIMKMCDLGICTPNDIRITTHGTK